MPGQKNSGAKGRKRESGVAVRHRNLITALADDLRREGKVDGVHIGRVIQKLGNGRMKVFYVADKVDDEVEKNLRTSYEVQAVIKGSFRGRGKHSVWVDIGGIVILNDTGLGIMEIVGVLTQEQLNDIAKTSFIDERIMKPISKEGDDSNTGGVEFAEESDKEDISDGDIDNI